MSLIFTVNGHVNNCAHMMTINIFNAQMIHQLGISSCYGYSVNLGNHTIAADLFNICHTASVYRFAISLFQAFADRMGRCTLCKCCILQKLVITHVTVMDACNFKHTFCHSACFIKYNVLCLGQCFKIIGSFYKDSLITGSADPCKKA